MGEIKLLPRKRALSSFNTNSNFGWPPQGNNSWKKCVDDHNNAMMKNEWRRTPINMNSGANNSNFFLFFRQIIIGLSKLASIKRINGED